MKFIVTVIFVLVAQSLVPAQRIKDPGMHKASRLNGTSAGPVHRATTSSGIRTYRPFSSATDLAKIEQRSIKSVGTAPKLKQHSTGAVPKTQQTSIAQGKNKRMKFSYRSPNSTVKVGNAREPSPTSPKLH